MSEDSQQPLGLGENTGVSRLDVIIDIWSWLMC